MNKLTYAPTLLSHMVVKYILKAKCPPAQLVCVYNINQQIQQCNEQVSLGWMARWNILSACFEEI